MKIQNPICMFHITDEDYTLTKSWLLYDEWELDWNIGIAHAMDTTFFVEWLDREI